MSQQTICWGILQSGELALSFSMLNDFAQNYTDKILMHFSIRKTISA